MVCVQQLLRLIHFVMLVHLSSPGALPHLIFSQKCQKKSGQPTDNTAFYRSRRGLAEVSPRSRRDLAGISPLSGRDLAEISFSVGRSVGESRVTKLQLSGRKSDMRICVAVSVVLRPNPSPQLKLLDVRESDQLQNSQVRIESCCVESVSFSKPHSHPA